jgi:hypothetical protein
MYCWLTCSVAETNFSVIVVLVGKLQRTSSWRSLHWCVHCRAMQMTYVHEGLGNNPASGLAQHLSVASPDAVRAPAKESLEVDPKPQLSSPEWVTRGAGSPQAIAQPPPLQAAPFPTMQLLPSPLTLRHRWAGHSAAQLADIPQHLLQPVAPYSQGDARPSAARSGGGGIPGARSSSRDGVNPEAGRTSRSNPRMLHPLLFLGVHQAAVGRRNVSSRAADGGQLATAASALLASPMVAALVSRNGAGRRMERANATQMPSSSVAPGSSDAAGAVAQGLASPAWRVSREAVVTTPHQRPHAFATRKISAWLSKRTAKPISGE